MMEARQDTALADRESVWYLRTTPGAVTGWLTRLWWTAAAVDGALLVASLLLPADDFPLKRLAPLLAASALLHAEMARPLTRAPATARVLNGLCALIQTALLTGLLELSGGPSNAFAVVYVIQIALAALTLGAGWGWLTAGWSVVCYGVLISWHLEELVPAHHRLVDFPTQLFTMWIAIAALAALAGHFAGTASRAVAHRDAQLDRMRQDAARDAHLISLTTLAAGAAHELSTPLATIAIASKELERTLTASPVPPEWIADARLIREEVDRCQLILDEMSGRAGGRAAEQPEAVAVDAVLADVRTRLPFDLAARLRTAVRESLPAVVVPRAGLVQVLLSLVRNAFDASDAGQAVNVGVEADRGVLRFVIQDEGRGMSADTLRRAGEPFYSTKSSGRGLGLFLARVFAERCGGSLALRSGPGTTAILELPAPPVRMEPA